jgi:predicted glycosyltransferase
MQHGLINQHHLGYNPSIDLGEIYRPDHLLTFGYREISIFKKDNPYIDNHRVHPVGNFYFDYLIKEYVGDAEILRLRKNYSTVVCVSAEFDMENQIIPIVNKAAKKLKHFLFLYMPRNRKATAYSNYQFESNFVITDWLNSYQVIRQADFHTCVSSTTALEALALGTQNVLINLHNYSVTHFSDVLTDRRITIFVNPDVEEYIRVLATFPKLSKKEVMESDNNTIAPNFKENLRSVIPKILSN